MASEVDIIADACARLIRAKLLPPRSAGAAARACGITVNDISDALKRTEHDRLVMPSRLVLVTASEDAQVNSPTATTQKTGNDEWAATHPLFPTQTATHKDPTEAALLLAARIAALATNRGATVAEQPHAGFLSADDELAAQQRRAQAKTVSRPHQIRDGVMWLRCTCQTGCGPDNDGWRPADDFAARADRPGRRRSLANDCYKTGLRRRRVTTRLEAELNAIGVTFSFDPSGHPNALSCTGCGQRLRRGELVTSAAASLSHVTCPTTT